MGRVAAACVGLALAAALAGCRRREGVDWRVEQLFAGQASIHLLQHPSRVQAFRLDPAPGQPRPDDVRAGPYRATSAPVDVAAADAAALADVFADPATYDWRRAKDCKVRPGVGLWFIRGSDVLQLALCFECDEVLVYPAGQFSGIEDFDAARPRLVAIAKRLFPRDADIQSLR